MTRLSLATAIAVLCCAGCSGPAAEKPVPREAAETQKLPSLDEAVSKLKDDLKDAAEAAKAHIAENADAEIERIAKQLQEVADDFGANSDQLQGEARTRYDEMRMEFEKKKELFDQKFREFREGSAGAKQELLKGLYEALTEMKDALDRAAEAFRQGVVSGSERAPA